MDPDTHTHKHPHRLQQVGLVGLTLLFWLLLLATAVA